MERRGREMELKVKKAPLGKRLLQVGEIPQLIEESDNSKPLRASVSKHFIKAHIKPVPNYIRDYIKPAAILLPESELKIVTKKPQDVVDTRFTAGISAGMPYRRDYS
jgi:hypothetical protein